MLPPLFFVPCGGEFDFLNTKSELVVKSFVACRIPLCHAMLFMQVLTSVEVIWLV